MSQVPPVVNLGPAVTAYTVQSIDASVELTAGVYVSLFSVPTSAASATVNLRFVSHSLTSDITIRAAIIPSAGYSAGATPTSGWIQPVDLDIGPNGIGIGIIEDTAIVISPGNQLIVYANSASQTGVVIASARAHGFLKTGS